MGNENLIIQTLTTHVLVTWEWACGCLLISLFTWKSSSEIRCAESSLEVRETFLWIDVCFDIWACSICLFHLI